MFYLHRCRNVKLNTFCQENITCARLRVLTVIVLCDVVEYLAHGVASLRLGLLHGVELHEDCVDLAHDAANTVFKTIHAPLDAEGEWGGSLNSR